MRTVEKTNHCRFYTLIAVIIACILVTPLLLQEAYSQQGNTGPLQANKMKFSLMTYTFARQDWKKDGSIRRDFSNELIGEGDINFTECVKAMVNDGYRGYIDIEYEGNKYTPDAANQKTIEYINNILKLN